MKLWLIKQDVNNNYDTYDEAVVCAESEEAARMIHPAGGTFRSSSRYDWAYNPEQVSVTYIGEASSDLEPGSVVCASYNAG